MKQKNFIGALRKQLRVQAVNMDVSLTAIARTVKFLHDEARTIVVRILESNGIVLQRPTTASPPPPVMKTLIKNFPGYLCAKFYTNYLEKIPHHGSYRIGTPKVRNSSGANSSRTTSSTGRRKRE